LWALVVPILAVVLFAGQLPASAVGVAHGSIVSATPSNRTPQILDGRVTDLEEVGNRIVVTGTFTRVQNVAANGGAILNRNKVFAFDPATGAVDTAFVPAVTGTAVNTAAEGPNGTVYLGGAFTAVNGTTVRNVVQVTLATGAPTPFRPAAISGAVNDLMVSGSRLFVGGTFTTVGAVEHRGLATLNATTGALDAYMGVDVAVNHNWTTGSTGAKGAVGVSKLDIFGGRLVAIGNFKQADGLVRDQAVVVLLQAGSAVVDPNWRTQRYEARCLAGAYDSYIRDVEFAPNGSYFVIVTTGGPNPGTLCDTAARWDVADSGQNVQPRWIADTGGDTLFSVAVTGAAVYVGGHQRWMNNATGRDFSATGAVPRPGIAALDPLNGVPLSWNAGRNPRGIGAEALLATSTGLYVGMDTDYFGNRQHLRKKLGFFPLAGGTPQASQVVPALPANVYLAGRPAAVPGAGVDAVLTRTYNGTTAGTDATAASGGVAWGQARGAFYVGGNLYYGFPQTPGSAASYRLVKRTFNGTTYGPATFITTPYLDPAWAGVPTGSGTSTYDGKLPNFYGAELSTVTGMFYADGKLFYTKTGSTALLSRGFSVESGIVENVSTTVAATGFGDAGGMFVSGGFLYFANRTTGDLRRVQFTDGAPTGAVTLVTAGRNWNSRALFLGPAGGAAPANVAPTAAMSSSCAGLTCSFDGSGSADPDGDTLTYSWDFGDSETGTGVNPDHTYAAAGTYPVRLTVTDAAGDTATASRSVTVTQPPAGQGIAVRAATGAARTTSGTSIGLTVPTSVAADDGLVLVLTTNSGVTGTAPAGYTEVDRHVNGSTTTTYMTTQVFQKVATADDGGATLSVTLGGSAKATLQLAAYAGTSLTNPVRLVNSQNSTAGATTHTTPTANAAAGEWALQVWADKAAAARSWTAPGAVRVRDSRSAGATSGEIASLVADTGPSAGGSVGGHTATVSAASSRATVVTVILAPAG
jgi:PKD repeat protein